MNSQDFISGSDTICWNLLTYIKKSMISYSTGSKTMNNEIKIYIFDLVKYILIEMELIRESSKQ